MVKKDDSFERVTTYRNTAAKILADYVAEKRVAGIILEQQVDVDDGTLDPYLYDANGEEVMDFIVGLGNINDPIMQVYQKAFETDAYRLAETIEEKIGVELTLTPVYDY